MCSVACKCIGCLNHDQPVVNNDDDASVTQASLEIEQSNSTDSKDSHLDDRADSSDSLIALPKLSDMHISRLHVSPLSKTRNQVLVPTAKCPDLPSFTNDGTKSFHAETVLMIILRHLNVLQLSSMNSFLHHAAAVHGCSAWVSMMSFMLTEYGILLFLMFKYFCLVDIVL